MLLVCKTRTLPNIPEPEIWISAIFQDMPLRYDAATSTWKMVHSKGWPNEPAVAAYCKSGFCEDRDKTSCGKTPSTKLWVIKDSTFPPVQFWMKKETRGGPTSQSKPRTRVPSVAGLVDLLGDGGANSY